MTKVTQKQVNKVLKLHKMWLNNEKGGKRLDLSNNNLMNCDFSGLDFSDANFRGTDFYGANFCDANFCDANFCDANFCDANFRGANFRGANLDIKTNERTSFIRLQCPEEGDFIGYKKCQDKLVKLLITGKRSSATTRKCRCSEAKVLEIEGDLKEISSNYDSDFVYRVGETVKVDNFDENRWNECSAGIHFFITKIEAQQY